MVESDVSADEKVWLKGQTEDGNQLTACFTPSKGMNLVSLKKGACEVIDQTTQPLFDERFAGLGAMIGPHFHHRLDSVIPPVKNPSLFPHIEKVLAKGSKEPFSHGIGRYAPWRVDRKNEHSIQAQLSGDDTWNGVLLKELEGQNFKLSYIATLVPKGLEIELSVSGETESVVGLHTYYALGGGEGSIQAKVQDHYVDKSTFKPIPSSWNYQEDHTLTYPLDQETDFGFHPFPDPLHAEIKMICPSHTLSVQYWCPNAENSFQIWHPKGASFVCIEPLAAKDPRKPKLTVNTLKVLISVMNVR